MTITSVRGFNDILPGECELWRLMEREAYSVFSSYGFLEIKVPAVEKTELFTRSIGETTDIVEKEMYTFVDRRGDSLTLRPEGTAPVVRAYIQHKLYTTPIQKLYYTGPMFRYERPQKGRYRQFYQIGAEVLGDDSPKADAETLVMLMSLFRRLGLDGVNLGINSLGCSECRPVYKERLLVFLNEKTEALCDNCRRRIEANPLRALDCKSPKCIQATGNAPSILDFLCSGCSSHFAEVENTMKLRQIEFTVEPRMVRGLDYYTKTTFEVTSDGLGSQNAIAAGGRYDELVEALGGPVTPCFGFAIGVERVALLLKEKGFSLKPLSVFIALGPEAEARGMALVKSLRDKGLRVIEDFSIGTLKSRMKRADRLGARFAIILGDDELESGVVTVKDMESAVQEKLPWDAVPERLGG
jgi:histidyl-tRNA synthetase